MPSGSLIEYTGRRGVVWYAKVRVREEGVERQRKIKLGKASDGMNRRDAQRALGRLLDELDSGERTLTRETLEAFAARFLDVYLPSRNLKRTTLVEYRNTLERHVLPALGHLPMATIAMQPELLDRYIADKMSEGLAPKTIGNHLSTLSKMFEVAMRWRIVGSNPVTRIDRPKVDTPETLVLTEVEVARLLAAYREFESTAADGDRAWWELARRLTTVALGTALRRGELLGLRWQDVQLLEGRLHVRQAFVMGAMTTPKSRASRRTVSFGPVTQAALQEQWSCSRYRSDSDLVFGHPLLGTPLDPSKISRVYMRKAIVRAAITKQIRVWHDLRHTALTMDAAAGNPAAYIQARAGHSQGSITERYIHAAQVAFPGAAERAEVRLFGEPVPRSVPNELPGLDSNQQPFG